MVNKWVDRITATGWQAVLINQHGREIGRVGAFPISFGRKRQTTGYPFMIGRDKAGVYPDFIGAKTIVERVAGC